jgi:hypothetical protein
MVYTNATSSEYYLTAVKAHIKGIGESQRGDPPKGAKALYHLATLVDPPRKAVLGSDAYGWLHEYMTAEHEDLLRNKSLARSTDVDD